MANKERLKNSTGLFKAKRKLYKGTPTIFVNGAPIHGGAVLYRNDPAGPMRFRHESHSFRKICPDIVMAYANFEVKPDQDLTYVNKWFEELFSEHPHAFGACHIGLQPSLEWVQANPTFET